MINKQKKRLEITLTNEDIELLNSLASRFNITKSNVIKQALKVFAAKRKHIFTISYRETNEENNTKIKTNEVEDVYNKLDTNDEEEENFSDMSNFY